MKDLRIDEKGKFFTSHISKRSARVIAATSGNILRGAMHLMLDNRLKDELNAAERFVAMTDVRVLSLDGNTVLYSAPAIVLNKELLVWVIPDDNDTESEESEN